MGGPFSKKGFSEQMGEQNVFVNVMRGRCSIWAIDDQIMPRAEEF